MKKEYTVKQLNIRCALFLALYYVQLYLVGVMFSSYLLHFGFSKATVTTVASISSALSLISKPIFAAVIDKGHCRSLACFYTALVLLGVTIFFVVGGRSPISAICYSLFASFGNGGLMGLSDSWTLKLIKQYEGVDYGKVRAFGSISFAVTGLIYGAAITKFGYGIVPVCIYSVAILVLLSALSLPDPMSVESAGKSSILSKLGLFKNRRFMVYVMFGILVQSAFSLSDTFIPVLILEKGGTEADIGLSSFVMAAIEFIMLPMFTTIADRVGTVRILGFGMIGFVIKTLTMSLMPTAKAIVIAGITQIVSFCFFIPGQMRFVQTQIDQENLATALTLFSLCSSLYGIFIANPIAGRLSESIGTAAMFRVFSVVTAVGAAGFIIGMKLLDKKEAKEAAKTTTE